jgi:DNA polymerase III epsilon subunit-like protein
MTDIMIDLETGGTRPGCAIYSIGACVMQKDLIHAPQHQFYQNVTQRPARGFHTDQATLDWWAQQSPEARAVLEHNQIPIKSALAAFHEWAAQYPEPRRFWACGSHFDYSIYAAACHLTDTPVAFKFWLVRDTRTALDVAGVSKKDADKAIPSDVREKLVKHHALSDCIEQTYHVLYAQKAVAKRTAIGGHRGLGGFLPYPVVVFIIGILLAILCFAQSMRNESP